MAVERRAVETRTGAVIDRSLEQRWREPVEQVARDLGANKVFTFSVTDPKPVPRR